MYFIVIMAFVLVLTDDLPLTQFVWMPQSSAVAWAVWGQVAVVATLAAVSRSRTLAEIRRSGIGSDDAPDVFSRWQQVTTTGIALFLLATMLGSPWPIWVRRNLDFWYVPLIRDLVILGPFFVSLVVTWIIVFPVELALRGLVSPDGRASPNAAAAARVGWHRSLGAFLVDNFRHQVLFIAAPMLIILVAKQFIDLWRGKLIALTHLVWSPDAVLGLVSVSVLFISPMLLRYVWSTKPLPAGPLRDRFVQMCDRIGLKYREILLWQTHGMTVNAAVMGLIPSVRYILVSDALLGAMQDDEVEAVFGHEAGHVHHWHLVFFGLFAWVSMYAAGAILLGIAYFHPMPKEWQEMCALATVLLFWLFGFGWVSRKFERQADLFAVRCVTADIRTCVDACPVHGTHRGGLCVSAASLFGRTLLKIADLNGIATHAPSWRHGTIASRCQLLEHMTHDEPSLRRFDRQLKILKLGLVFVTVVGTLITVKLYLPSVREALRMGFDLR